MSFYGVLGEDSSDAESVAILVRRLREKFGLPIIKVKHHGYNGCSHLVRKAVAQLRAWEKAGCVRAIVCQDADGPDPDPVRRFLVKDIIKASRVLIPCCPLVPVEEIEAWALGHVAVLGEMFHWCRGLDQHNHPESIRDPKEYIIALSRNPATGRPGYHPPTRNPVMARLIDLDLVRSRCPSFATLVAFVQWEVTAPDKDVLGKWLVAEFIRDGRPNDAASRVPGVAVIDVASLTFKVRRAVYKSALRLDVATTPRAFELTLENGRRKGALVRGVYEVDQDELRVCYAAPGEDRPTQLSSATGSGWTLVKLARVS